MAICKPMSGVTWLVGCSRCSAVHKARWGTSHYHLRHCVGKNRFTDCLLCRRNRNSTNFRRRRPKEIPFRDVFCIGLLWPIPPIFTSRCNPPEKKMDGGNRTFPESQKRTESLFFLRKVTFYFYLGPDQTCFWNRNVVVRCIGSYCFNYFWVPELEI